MAGEQPYDRWHISNEKSWRAQNRGKALPAPCGCGEGLRPSKDHGVPMRWQAQWEELPGPDGKRKRRHKNFPHNRKQAAAAWQRQMKAAVEEGRTPTLPRSRKQKPEGPTIAEYVETFLEEHEGRSGTKEAYGYRLRGHVVPALGDRPIVEMRRADYKRFFTQLRTDEVAQTTRSGVKKALSAMLTAALDDPDFGELMPGNQVIGLKVPQGRRAKVPLSWAHVTALAEEIEPGFEMLIWYGSLQGLRSMEASAVRKRRMLCKARKLDVQEQARDGGFAPPKTQYSVAVLPVGSFLIERYEVQMLRRAIPPSADTARKRVARGWQPPPVEFEDLVTVTRYGTPLDEEALCRRFKRAVRAARARGVMVPLEATFRDLRDFMDAVLIAAGVAPRSVQVRMRHGTLAETMDTYGFALEVDWENAPASFEELYGIPAPPGLPKVALVPRAKRRKRGALAPLPR
ncbi:hypothetical protein ABZ752_22600 [Streptomyces roseifaciens]